ncbi:PREDICTED: uncharacterized protein LOC108355355, partial [Rhagoletis zephyria]|uniref:uncharacterized protein LOC108355355 n=1 Tax=Rhagoletis zephyria TaxID=28612 RepID=UPI00081197C4
MCQKEKEIEQMWVDLAHRYNEEMLEQDNLEHKLLNAIARNNQERNLWIDERRKQTNKTINKALRDDFSEDDKRAAVLDKLYIARVKSVDQSKKLYQQKVIM